MAKVRAMRKAGAKYREIAAELGMPEATVAGMINRYDRFKDNGTLMAERKTGSQTGLRRPTPSSLVLSHSVRPGFSS